MRRIVCVFLSLVLILSLTACGKSSAVIDIEKKIDSLDGELEDRTEVITEIIEAYNALPDKDKQKVSNYSKFVEIRKDDALAMARAVYVALDGAASICYMAMQDIYAGWRYGIYSANERMTFSGNIVEMSNDTPNLTSDAMLVAAVKRFTQDELSDYAYKRDWSDYVKVVLATYEEFGGYKMVDDDLLLAQKLLKTLTTIDEEKKYTDTLTDYYKEVKDCADFVESPSGSFQNLSTTINNYNKNIKSLKVDLDLLLPNE